VKKKNTRHQDAYAKSGVRYSDMDPFKRLAMERGSRTAKNIRYLDAEEVSESRGESAHLVRVNGLIIAHVEEGLGTLNLVADDMYRLTGSPVPYYRACSYGTVAMILNDLATTGATPISVLMHLAVGDSAWLADEKRNFEIVVGWAEACDAEGCVWGGGETATLKGIVNPHTAVFSGSAYGYSEETCIKDRIREGDEIVLLSSSGIHCNGLTLAREIASKLPKGYLTPVSRQSCFGETLLFRTILYGKTIRSVLRERIPVSYAVNITGHGWRKLMRASGSWEYVIEQVPKPDPVFRFIQKHGNVSDYDAYANLNMGAGFALFVSPGSADRVVVLASLHGIRALKAGYVAKAAKRGTKTVTIKRSGKQDIVFTEKDLQIR